MAKAKILLLDIETAPNTAYVWGLFDQNIDPKQLEVSSYTLCWAAKWLGQSKMMYSSIHNDSHEVMLRWIHGLLSEADIVIHYNGMKFDIPTLNKDFIKHKLPVPAPFKQIDLLHVCRRAFRFTSNKLSYVAKALDLGDKVKHAGFELWVNCMKGDEAAWRSMEKYNKGDVKLLEKLYKRLLPWIAGHPSVSLVKHGLSCPKCASTKIQARGLAVARSKSYRRFQCQACGGWFRSNKATVKGTTEHGVNIS